MKFIFLSAISAEKLATLTGQGGSFVIPMKTTRAPVGEFQVNKERKVIS